MRRAQEKERKKFKKANTQKRKSFIFSSQPALDFSFFFLLFFFFSNFPSAADFLSLFFFFEEPDAPTVNSSSSRSVSSIERPCSAVWAPRLARSCRISLLLLGDPGLPFRGSKLLWGGSSLQLSSRFVGCVVRFLLLSLGFWQQIDWYQCYVMWSSFCASYRGNGEWYILRGRHSNKKI